MTDLLGIILSIFLLIGLIFIGVVVGSILEQEYHQFHPKKKRNKWRFVETTSGWSTWVGVYTHFDIYKKKREDGTYKYKKIKRPIITN